MSTEEITEILTKYAETPKNHMQVLEDRELSLIFEYLTQHNPVSSIAVIFAEGAKPEEKKAEPAPQAGAEAPAGCLCKAPTGRPGAKPQQSAPQPAKPEQKPQHMSRVPQKQVVDTRKATNVNLDKYDESCRTWPMPAPAASGSNRPQGKEKFRNKQRRDNNFASNKRKQEEADRLRKLRLRSSRRPPLPCRSPMRSPWASWPAA